MKMDFKMQDGGVDWIIWLRIRQVAGYCEQGLHSKQLVTYI
jgi:hypothetical protein